MRATLAFISLLVALLSSAVTAGTARAEQRPKRVVLLLVRDDSGQASVTALRRALEAALDKSPDFELLPRKPVLANAKRLHVSKDKYFEPETLRQIVAGTELDAALELRLVRSGSGYAAVLSAYDLGTGEPVHVRTADFSRPRLTQALARELSTGLLDWLTSPPPAPAPEETSEQPDGASSVEDPWAVSEDLSFDEVAQPPTNALGPVLWSGRVEVQHHRFAEDLGPTATVGRDSVEAMLRAKAETGAASAYAELAARRDFTNPERDRFEVTEAYGQLDLGPLSLRAGRLVVAWGTANAANPTDVLNPVDYRDVLRPEKVGTWMLRSALVMGPLLLEAYYLPLPQLHELPLVEGIDSSGAFIGPARWVSGGIEVPESPVPLTFTLSEPRPRRAKLANAQAAGRLAVSAGGFDVSLGYAYLFDRVPTPRVELVLEPPTPGATVSYVNRRLNVFTADAETTLGKLRLAGEAALFIPKGPRDVDAPYGTAVVGADYRSGQFFDQHAVHVFLDVCYGVLPQAAPGTEALDRFRVPFERAILARLAYEIGTDLTLDTDAVFSLVSRDVYVRPALEYAAGSLTRLRAGYEWLDGGAKGFFGGYSANRRFFLELEASF